MLRGPEASIFFHALEIESDSERDAYLRESCNGNSELLSCVSALLEAHFRDSVLDNPIANSSDRNDTIEHVAEIIPGESPQLPGTQIGPYKLMEQIGEGGFGLVFVAEQQRPVRRRVALKIIKPGMESRDVIARFEAERQALALMEHPNIARVIDANVTQAGRPYFVMELVRGVPLIDFCDQHKLDTIQRLELFVSICHALQHAHQKGIIHRDLKPSNVLVTQIDGRPLAKVIDFGVAKAIGQSLTDKTIYTRFSSMIGTPAYMSPEQAEMSDVDIDTRTDIYSLGVLLYELLTGSTPFRPDRLDSAGFDELRQIIREEEPPRPSTRLSTLEGEALSTVAANRQHEPSKISTIVKGDLDWIVMKAIDKDRDRRFGTASAFAEDIQRFMAEQPVEARPPSSAYRFLKFARRNKVTLTTILLVVSALFVGTVISVWQASVAIKERDEKNQALTDAIEARNAADAARQQLEQFADRLKEANLLISSGRANANSEQWASAHQDYTKAIELQPKYYHVWLERGALYVRLGLWHRAAEDYAQAFRLGAPTDGPDWWGVPQLLWLGGKKDEYEQLCRASQLSSTDHGFGMRASLFADSKSVPFSELASQAESMIGPADFTNNGSEHPHRRPKSHDDKHTKKEKRRFREPIGATLYVAGWAHYRAEDFELAVERLKQSNDSHWPGRGISYPLLALSYHRTGKGEEARQAFVQATEHVERWTVQMESQSIGQPPPIPWFDLIEFLAHYREASIIVTGFTPPDDPRLRKMKSRALNAIELR